MTLLGAMLCGGLLSYFVFDGGKPAPTATVSAAPLTHVAPYCNYTIARVGGYRMVRPLLFSEPLCESPRYEDLRNAVGALVQRYQASGKVNSASVYIRDFKKAEWTSYNGDERYDPGSLLKVPLLLTWLSMQEEDPSVLDRTYACETQDLPGKNMAFEYEHAAPQRSYTVKQLLDLMIIASDNRATSVLMRHVPMARFLRTFTDLGLPAPEVQATQYRMSVLEYSVFMKALYNSAYLSPTSSDRALDLMTRSEFKQGLLAGLPAEVQVAHKFGESGDDREGQLHETGLVYTPNNTYLITVMTKGKDIRELPEVLSAISKLVYERMSTGPSAQGF